MTTQFSPETSADLIDLDAGHSLPADSSDIGAEKPLIPDNQRSFISRGFQEVDVDSITPEQMEAVFANIPAFALSPAFTVRKDYDRHAHIKRSYRWLRGETTSALAREEGVVPSNISTKVRVFSQLLSKNFTLEQLISGEIPEVEEPAEEPPDETEEEDKYTRRARKFLALAYSGEGLDIRAIPAEVVAELVTTSPQLLPPKQGVEKGQTDPQVERLFSWLGGKTSQEIAEQNGVRIETVYVGRGNLAQRLRAGLSADALSGALERYKQGEPLSGLFEGLGAAALNGAGRWRENNGNGGQKTYSSEMTSAEFWRSPIPLPRPPIIKSSKIIKQNKANRGPLKGKTELLPNWADPDGEPIEVFVLPGVDGPAPLPILEGPNRTLEVLADGRVRRVENSTEDK